jgi:malic enzyme
MEGKAFLMKYLGGVDAVALCIDSKGKDGKNDPEKIIEFVKMCQHSFGAVNLEDISQPNCYRVLDVLREECIIPVWHDDAQGTACVTLAGLINALKLANKKIGNAKMVLFGAGAANTTIARLIIADGGDPRNMVYSIHTAVCIKTERISKLITGSTVSGSSVNKQTHNASTPWKKPCEMPTCLFRFLLQAPHHKAGMG